MKKCIPLIVMLYSSLYGMEKDTEVQTYPLALVDTKTIVSLSNNTFLKLAPLDENRPYLLELYDYKPTNAIAVGRGSKNSASLLASESHAPITGLDIFKNNHAFIVSRTDGSCTLFNLEGAESENEIDYVDKKICNEPLLGAYFTSTKTACCISANDVYEWNFTTGEVCHLGKPLTTHTNQSDFFSMQISRIRKSSRQSLAPATKQVSHSTTCCQLLYWLFFGRRFFKKK